MKERFHVSINGIWRSPITRRCRSPVAADRTSPPIARCGDRLSLLIVHHEWSPIDADCLLSTIALCVRSPVTSDCPSPGRPFEPFQLFIDSSMIDSFKVEVDSSVRSTLLATSKTAQHSWSAAHKGVKIYTEKKVNSKMISVIKDQRSLVL